MRIYNTKKYDSFKTVQGNRVVNPTHVKNLIKSISANNLLEYFPIAVNQDMEVIDGQHRLEAAKTMGLPVYYAVVYQTGLDDVQRINSNIINWKTNDYLHCFIEKKNENYIILNGFCIKYGLSVSLVMTLMGYNGKALDIFKAGKFKVKNLFDANNMAEKLNDLKPYCEGSTWKDRELIKALFEIYKKVTHAKLIKQLNKSGQKIIGQATTKDYMRVIEDIYNKRLHYKINFFS